MRLLHLADIHLGARFSGFGALGERRSEEHLARFRALPEIAEAHEAELVLICGDLFDDPSPGPEIRSAAEETFRTLAEASRPVFLVPGGHDPLRGAGSALRTDLGAHLFRSARFGEPVSLETSAGRVHLHGAAYDPARCPDPLSTFERGDLPGIHIALLHGVLPDSPDAASAPRSLAGLTLEALGDAGADYLALGGDHRFRPPDALGGLPAAYAGSFAGLHPGETGHRGPALVELGPDGAPAVRLVSSGVTPVVDLGEIEADDAEDEAELIETIVRRAGPDAIPVAHLIGSPGWPIDAEVIRAALVDRFGYAEVEDHMRSDRLLEAHGSVHDDTVIGHLVRLGRARVASAEGELATESAEAALRTALRSLKEGP